MFRFLKALRRFSHLNGRSERNSFRPGLECLGGGFSSEAPGRSRPHTFRPELEILEERRVMTTSGNISAVVDNLGHAVEYGIAPNHSVVEYAPGQRIALGGYVQQISAGRDANGRAQVFALGFDNSIWLNDTTSPSGWQRLQGWGLQITGTENNQLYVLATNHAVYVNNLSANSWQYLGGWVVEISVGRDAYGHDQVFALGGDGSTWRNDGNSPTAWQSLGASAYQIEGTDHNEVYIIDANHGVSVRNFSADAGWQSLGGYALRISAGTDTQGRDDVFVIAGDWTPWVIRSTGWHELVTTSTQNGNLGGRSGGGTVTTVPHVTDITGTGGDTVFAVASDNSALEYTPATGWRYQYDYLL
jgi:hypothetical protein